MRRRLNVDRGVEILAERRAERRLITAGDADRIDGAGPRAARVRAKETGKRARLGLEPLRGALGVGERPTGAPLRFAGRRVALLGGDRFALSGGERLGKPGDGFGARRPLRLLEAEASQFGALALDSLTFRLEARQPAPLLLDRAEERPAPRIEVGRRRLGLGERAFGAGRTALGARFRFVRPRRLSVGFRALGGKRGILGGEPVHDPARIGDQRFLALMIAGELGHPALELGRALPRPLRLRFERFAGERDAMEGRAAPRLLLAQLRQGGGGERLQARGLSLSPGALGDFDQVGVEPPARLGERRLVLAPGDQAGERLVAADGAGEVAVAVRLARLALEAVDLGVDLLQHVLDTDEIVVRAL